MLPKNNTLGQAYFGLRGNLYDLGGMGGKHIKASRPSSGDQELGDEDFTHDQLFYKNVLKEKFFGNVDRNK